MGPADAGFRSWLAPGLGRQDGLDELRRQDTVPVDEGLEDHTGRRIRERRRVDRLAGRRIEEVLGRAKDQRDVAIELRELDHFRLLGVDREGDDLLLAVERRAVLAACRRLALLA